jgi:hypothetical protein
MAARILGCFSDSARATLRDCVAVPAPAVAADRLDVYAGGYPARVRDALADTHPALARLVGEAAFAALAQRYAAAMPLTSYNLNDAGAHLAAFVAGDALGRAYPFLADLAALEWCIAQAFHAAERPALDPRALAWSLDDWDRAVLELQPSVAVLASRWPLLALWERGDAAPDEARRAAGAAQAMLIRRAGLVVRCEAISAGEAAALRLLLDGQTLGAVMEQLGAAGHDAETVSQWCAGWMRDGIVAGAHRAP